MGMKIDDLGVYLTNLGKNKVIKGFDIDYSNETANIYPNNNIIQVDRIVKRDVEPIWVDYKGLNRERYIIIKL